MDFRDQTLFGLPPGADFAAALVDGLCAKFAKAPPTDLARVQIIMNMLRPKPARSFYLIEYVTIVFFTACGNASSTFSRLNCLFSHLPLFGQHVAECTVS